METTKENFNFFIEECKYWIEKFGLKEWEFRFKHEDHKTLKDSCAWYEYNWQGRLASIGLSVSWDNTEPTDYQVSKSAFHEICEMLLADLETIARSDICPSQKEELITCKHSVIRRIEWAIWEPYYENKKAMRLMSAGQTCPPLDLTREL